MRSTPQVENFASRHIGPSSADQRDMLQAINAEDIETLIDQTVPRQIRQSNGDAAAGISEHELLEKIWQIAKKNRVFRSLIGQGYYGTHLPPVIQRNVLENPAWYTAYTPYQPEISQGRLEALLNFQTMISDLTALPVANASLLDEATAAAEAMALARRVSRNDRTSFFVDHRCHPQTISVLRTRADSLGWSLIVESPDRLDACTVFGAIFQYPDTNGVVSQHRDSIEKLHAEGAIVIFCADVLALTMLVPPGELGVDIAVGSSQRFGVPLGYGGPHAAYIACKDDFKRSLPGRIVGVSVDARGVPAFRLALQTREQHIRREKATSNICTAQALPAILASMFAVYHGPEGLLHIAQNVHRLTCVLAEGLRRQGLEIGGQSFFDTIHIEGAPAAADIVGEAEKRCINFRKIWNTDQSRYDVGISLDETTTEALVEEIWEIFGQRLDFAVVAAATEECLDAALQRNSAFLTHPVFSRYRSETNFLRYLRALSDRDLALDRTMIPLGSCTMKLNATAEMAALTWPEFSHIHPFAPDQQALGYQELVCDLENELAQLTGYDRFSFQPNSGAQGEYAGLLAIKAYHASRNEQARDVCLIPSSAHGTNPASAQMAGMNVIVVNCDAEGNVDLQDLTRKADTHAQALAALMITYPSTHGVFEEKIREICSVVHARGGLIYLDGANLNAQVGLARPGDYGADVGHLNLHKTFCIPHGGGGPGMGPIGVKQHLVPFLPRDPGLTGVESGVGAVAASKWSSASLLTISWAFIKLMGHSELRRATATAILNANYIANRLDAHFTVLFRGKNGRVAHECILDLRPLTQKSGVTVEDVAKRLIDYGFHAPTMSFPVPGTLMVEPTESESKSELDRFCDAMVSIRIEIDDVTLGRVAVAESVLRRAPHTVADLVDDKWDRAYSRQQAAQPARSPGNQKYWPPVNRIDNAFGDRNLICSCPPMDDYISNASKVEDAEETSGLVAVG